MSDQKTPKNFLGLPIEGDVYRRSHDVVTQRPAEELAPLIEAVLADPQVEAVRWRQYTPYFNDGEPCVFGASGASVWMTGTDEDSEDGDYEDGFLDSWTWKYSSAPEKAPACAEPLEALEDALESGAFDHALLELFGDHAVVTVRAGKAIEVETYYHD